MAATGPDPWPGRRRLCCSMPNGMDRCPGGGSLAPFPPQSSRGDSYAGSRFPCISTPRQILHCDLQIARICAAMPCAAMPCHALSSADCPREHCGPLRWSEANRHGGHAGAKAGVSPSFPPFSGMGIKMGLAISKPSDTLARRFFFFLLLPRCWRVFVFLPSPPKNHAHSAFY